MDALAPRTPLAAWLIGVVAICVAAIAVRGAASWYEHPFPGVLITPDGLVSSIGMPEWSGIQQGLRFPDRLVSVDGEAVVPSDGRYAAEVVERQVARAWALGHRSVHAKVSTAKGDRELDLRLEPMDAASWWLYGGTTIFTGALCALAAIIAIVASPRGALARTFAKCASAAALYCLTFFDDETTRTMVPLFYLAFAFVPFTLTTLALRLPDDTAVVVRFPFLPRALELAGLLLATLLVTSDFARAPITGLLTVCTVLLGAALMTFVVLFGVRFARARGTRRETLRVLFWATASPYLLVGGGVLVALLSSRGSVAAFFGIPAMALAPLATGVAFVRHDLWGSRALLSRVMTRAIAGAIACVVAVGVGSAVATSAGIAFRGALFAAAAGAVVSAFLVNVVTRAVERAVFPAAAHYKPTIAQLSEELTAITDPNEVALAVERTVRRWLPCDRVEFELDRPSDPSGRRSAEPSEGLTIRAEFGGRVLGVLVVGSKRGDALFTTDDFDLLQTIANQAALALAHARSYAELERRRQQQAAAWQTERIALVETVAAEIAHEVRYSINFFRTVFRRNPNTKLDSEEIEIGCEEVDRLERLVTGMRRMLGHRIERRAVPMADLVARAEVLLRDVVRGRSFDVGVSEDATVRCDPDQVTQVLVNLVANAVEATGALGHIGVDYANVGRGAELIVWDDGPGFVGDPSDLFAPWFTTKSRGTGLGLAITQRIVRAHGWSIDAVRTDGRTRFVVSIPSSDVLHEERRSRGDSEPMALLDLKDEGHEDIDRR